MTRACRKSFPNATLQRILLVIASDGIAPRQGGFSADTIILKSGTGTLPIEASIVAIDAKEVIYTATIGNRQSRKPVRDRACCEIKFADEPRLSRRRASLRRRQVGVTPSPAIRRAITASTADWAGYASATVRLIDAAARDKQYAPQVAGFIELAKRDPANAAAHRPGFTGVKADQIGAAIAAVDPALKSPGLQKESADVLRQFLADLNLARGNAARGGGETGNPATAPAAPTGGAIGPHGAGLRAPFAADHLPSRRLCLHGKEVGHAQATSCGRRSAALQADLRLQYHLLPRPTVVRPWMRRSSSQGPTAKANTTRSSSWTTRPSGAAPIPSPA